MWLLVHILLFVLVVWFVFVGLCWFVLFCLCSCYAVCCWYGCWCLDCGVLDLLFVIVYINSVVLYISYGMVLFYLLIDCFPFMFVSVLWFTVWLRFVCLCLVDFVVLMLFACLLFGVRHCLVVWFQVLLSVCLFWFCYVVVSEYFWLLTVMLLLDRLLFGGLVAICFLLRTFGWYLFGCVKLTLLLNVLVLSFVWFINYLTYCSFLLLVCLILHSVIC